jgi:hypothetical protein
MNAKQKNMIKILKQKLDADGGFTVYVNSKDCSFVDAKIGYAVSDPRYTVSFPYSDMFGPLLIAMIGMDSVGILGGWNDSENERYELSIPDIFGGLHVAMEVAANRKERYIYDLANKAELPVADYFRQQDKGN